MGIKPEQETLEGGGGEGTLGNFHYRIGNHDWFGTLGVLAGSCSNSRKGLGMA